MREHLLLDQTLLENPELSLHPAVVQNLDETIHFMQKRKSNKRQVILSTHSYDLLNDKGISADEIIILTPIKEGTKAENAYGKKEVKELLEADLSEAEAVLPFTESPKIV